MTRKQKEIEYMFTFFHVYNVIKYRFQTRIRLQAILRRRGFHKSALDRLEFLLINALRSISSKYYLLRSKRHMSAIPCFKV